MRKRIATTVAFVGLTTLAGASRAEDLASGPRASIVLPAGDRVHGHLRGGETHVFEVHLAQGDVYSFNIAVKGRDLLYLHASFRDPSGREINAEAGVRHATDGRRVSMSPYRVPKSGSYTIELKGDTLQPGDYVGSTKVRAHKTSFAVRTDGLTGQVDVPAGATIKLRSKGAIDRLFVALPDEMANEFAGDDALVTSLRTTGLASSGTGLYAFGAPNADQAITVEVRRPKWKAANVEFPTIPEDAASDALINWAKGWNTSMTTPFQLDPPLVGRPLAVDSAPTRALRSSLFMGGDHEVAMGVFAPQFAASNSSAIYGVPTPPLVTNPPAPIPVPPVENKPADPVVPPVPPLPPVFVPIPPNPPAVIPAPPTPPVVNPPSTPTPPATPAPNDANPSAPKFQPASLLDGSTFAGLVLTDGQTYASIPYLSHSDYVGKSAFAPATGYGASGSWRWTGWSDALGNAASLLPTSTQSSEEVAKRVVGPASDPSVTRSFKLYVTVAGKQNVFGSITTTTRFFVDGHQVANLLQTKGSYEIDWTVKGSGTVGGVAWTIDGAWSNAARLADPTRTTRVSSNTSTWLLGPAFILDGSETFTAGEVVEKVSVSNLSGFTTGCDIYDVAGTIKNDVSIPGLSLHQSVVRESFAGNPTLKTKAVTLTANTYDDGVSPTNPAGVQTINIKNKWWR